MKNNIQILPRQKLNCLRKKCTVYNKRTFQMPRRNMYTLYSKRPFFEPFKNNIHFNKNALVASKEQDNI